MKRANQLNSYELQNIIKQPNTYYIGSLLYLNAIGKDTFYERQEQFIYKIKSFSKIYSKKQLEQSNPIDKTKFLLIPNQIQIFLTKLSQTNLIKVGLFVNKSKQIKQNHNILQLKCRCQTCVVQLRIDVYLTDKIFNMEFIQILEDQKYYENRILEQKRILKNLKSRKIKSFTEQHKHKILINQFTAKQNQINNVNYNHARCRSMIPVLFQLFKIRKNYPVLIKPMKNEWKFLSIRNLNRMLKKNDLFIFVKNKGHYEYYFSYQQGFELINEHGLFSDQILQDENIPEEIKEIHYHKLKQINQLFQQKKQQQSQPNNIPNLQINQILFSTSTFKKRKTDIEIDEELALKALQLESKINQENKYYQQCNIKLNYPLYDFQKQAITWMMYRQGRLALKDLFKVDYQNNQWIKQYQRKISPYYEEIVFPNNQSIYFNQTSNIFTKKFYQWSHVKGGILADQMGLGKTIISIGLILQDSYEYRKNQGNNLIITPLSVINQWQQEIIKFSPKQLNVFCYHDDKNKNKVDLSQYDIVITTYTTMVVQFKKYKLNKSNNNKEIFLFDYKWRRIILDEAHNIKNRETLTAKAAFAINSQFRWCLTGTPLQNNTAQLFSLFKFLHVQLFSQWHWWNQHIQKAEDDQARYLIVHKIMRPILLRRQVQKLLNLPKKLFKGHRLEFNQKQKIFYDRFHKISKEYVYSILDDQKTKNKYNHIFEIILRLRQLTCHPKLVFNKKNIKYQHFTQQIRDYFVRSPDLLETIQNYKKGQAVTCPNCNIIPAQLVQYDQCSHVFCVQCLLYQHETQKKCPECKKIMINQKIRFIFTYNSQNLNFNDEQLNIESSTKLKQIFRIIRLIQDRNQKCVVFSQWVTFLDLMYKTCHKNNIKYCTITGSVSKTKRTEQVKIFQEDPSISVMFISLTAGAHGLNLTMANNIILADPWWNPAVQNQAIARVYRIGQTKEVKIYRLIVKDTIQERLLEIHQRKTKQLNYALMKTHKKKENMRSMVTSFFGQADLQSD